MIFFQSLYDWLNRTIGDKYNHFWLVHLSLRSLDRALQLFLFWVVGRSIWLFFKKSKTKKSREVLLWFFVFYMILLFQLTVFRYDFSLDTLQMPMQSLGTINWIPFEETLKLRYGLTMFDFLYNMLGNIGWFVPLGFMLPFLLKDRFPVARTIFAGFMVSVVIETMQFIFRTGITDIDDVIFNTAGAVIGVLIYCVFQGIYAIFRGRRLR